MAGARSAPRLLIANAPSALDSRRARPAQSASMRRSTKLGAPASSVRTRAPYDSNHCDLVRFSAISSKIDLIAIVCSMRPWRLGKVRRGPREADCGARESLTAAPSLVLLKLGVRAARRWASSYDSQLGSPCGDEPRLDRRLLPSLPFVSSSREGLKSTEGAKGLSPLTLTLRPDRSAIWHSLKTSLALTSTATVSAIGVPAAPMATKNSTARSYPSFRPVNPTGNSFNST